MKKSCGENPRIGLLGCLGYRFESGQEIRHDLQREQNGKPRHMAEIRTEISWRAPVTADEDEDEEHQQNRGGCPVLENRARADAPVVEPREKRGDRQAQQQTGEKYGLPGDTIKFPGIQLRKNVRRQFTDRDSLPRTNDEIGEQHDPAGQIAHEWRKNLRGVGRFSGRIRQSRHPLSIDVTHRQKEHASDRKPQHRPKRASPAEPIVHYHDPAGTDHGAKAEREIVPGV